MSYHRAQTENPTAKCYFRQNAAGGGLTGDRTTELHWLIEAQLHERDARECERELKTLTTKEAA